VLPELRSGYKAMTASGRPREGRTRLCGQGCGLCPVDGTQADVIVSVPSPSAELACRLEFRTLAAWH